MATTTTRPRAQIAMDETRIENLTLEEALKDREDAKDELKPMRIAFKAADGLSARPLGRINIKKSKT